MAINNSEFNPKSNEPISASIENKEQLNEATLEQSMKLAKEFIQAVGLPEILSDGLITQEEAKKMFENIKIFAQKYQETTGKDFDMIRMFRIFASIPDNKQLDMARELGMNIDMNATNIKVETTDGRIITMAEFNAELMKSTDQEIRKDIANTTRAKSKKLTKTTKQLAQNGVRKDIPNKQELDLTADDGKKIGAGANKIELNKGGDFGFKTEEKKDVRITQNPQSNNLMK